MRTHSFILLLVTTACSVASPTICCAAMIPTCLACQKGLTEDEYCQMNPGQWGCPDPQPPSAPMSCGGLHIGDPCVTEESMAECQALLSSGCATSAIVAMRTVAMRSLRIRSCPVQFACSEDLHVPPVPPSLPTSSSPSEQHQQQTAVLRQTAPGPAPTLLPPSSAPAPSSLGDTAVATSHGSTARLRSDSESSTSTASVGVAVPVAVPVGVAVAVAAICVVAGALLRMYVCKGEPRAHHQLGSQSPGPRDACAIDGRSSGLPLKSNRLIGTAVAVGSEPSVVVQQVVVASATAISHSCSSSTFSTTVTHV